MQGWFKINNLLAQIEWVMYILLYIVYASGVQQLFVAECRAHPIIIVYNFKVMSLAMHYYQNKKL